MAPVMSPRNAIRSTRCPGATPRLYKLTAGNPFFVSEALPAPGEVPATVVDAVLARVRRLGPSTQAALEQLAIVPSRVELPLARALLGDDMEVLADTERRGMIEVRPTEIAFRHELARRALESSLPTSSSRMQLHARVLAVLKTAADPDLSRLVHHAVGAGDDATVIDAALRSNRAGAHSQEIDLYGELLRRRHLLSRSREADVLQACAMAMATTGRLTDALRTGQEAVAIREESGDQGALGTALVTLAQIQWALGRSGEALEVLGRAVTLLTADGDSRRHNWALTQRAVLLTAFDRHRETLATGEAAVAMAERLDAPELLSSALVVRGVARSQLGERDSVAEIARGIAVGAGVPHHQHVMTGHACLVQELWRTGMFTEAGARIEEGMAYAHERRLDLSVACLRGYLHRLELLHGRWDAAETGLRATAKEGGNWGDSLAALALLSVRRGGDDAAELIQRARDQARRTGSRYEVVPAAFAEVEHGLGTQTAYAGPRCTGGSARTYGNRGRRTRAWRTAALDAPPRPARALRIFDDLGACPAAALVRKRLRDLGVTRIRRAPQSTTRAHPAGLTERQTEILDLLCVGATNAEIAARLVLSVRTVDHHVSAVLQKLGVTSRREAMTHASSPPRIAAGDTPPTDPQQGHPAVTPAQRSRLCLSRRTDRGGQPNAQTWERHPRLLRSTPTCGPRQALRARSPWRPGTCGTPGTRVAGGSTSTPPRR